MKNIIWIVLFALASCSTAPGPVAQFSNELNCSERALERITKGSGESKAKDSKALTDAEVMQLREEIRNAVPSATQCYQNEVQSLGSDPAPYNVCLVIGTSSEGNLNFIDVEDKTHPLSASLKNCLIDVFSKLDLRKAKNATITQPVRLGPKRR